MAGNILNRKKFAVRELTTQVVTLYPSRAHVVRTIKDLSLQPASNEVTIYGVTPSADESSIKVEGTGARIITDMTIDLVDNPEYFEDVYPSNAEDLPLFKNYNSFEPDEEPPAVRNINSILGQLNWSRKEATEQCNAALGLLNLLENYVRSLLTTPLADIGACARSYQNLRAQAFENHKNGEIKLEKNEEEVKKLNIKKRKLLEEEKERKRQLDEAKTKEKKTEDREKQRIRSEKDRLKHERSQFWPKKVYKLVICLDTKSGMTPASSRRGSIDSLPKTPASSHANEKGNSDSRKADAGTIDLSFSYITNSASWFPRYDLAIDTISKSGSITYRAEFRNTTSETWNDAKVVLSTSQTSFQGLGEAIPQIQPWHIRLAKGYGEDAAADALFSRSEQDSRYRNRGLFGQKPQVSQNQLFGKSTGSNNNNSNTLSVPFGAQLQPARGGSFGASNNAPSGTSLFGASNNAPSGTSLFGAPSDSRQGGLFGSSSFANDQRRPATFGFSTNNQRSIFDVAPQASAATSAFASAPVQSNIVTPFSQPAPATMADEERVDLDDETITPDLEALAFEESTWEEAGLTTTYTVPGTKTIAPSNTTRRHKIASIPLDSITLSHIIVPKLRIAAFLKARLRNTSSTTLLRGPAGLTIDGTFLGNTTLPRSSPGEAFVLNLGVDPALNVVYSVPVVRRSESGVFQKEGSRIYTRSCTLTNTKNNTTIEATVLDQIPVSEDDKLKVEVLTPKGLRKQEDQPVKAGVGQINEGTGLKGSTYSENSAGADKMKWGKATAKMKKEGEIEWDVKLNPGQGVKLELEYEARFPGGEGIVGV